MISVCMATYNGAKYIKEQVDSILTQLGSNDELIVSDDSSTDNTLEILHSYKDSRIKIYNNNNFKGVVGNFENALNHAQGDYIFLSDQDDVWLEGKVCQCLDSLQRADLVLHNAQIWNGEKIIHPSFFAQRQVKRGYLNNIIRNSYIGCCMALRSTLKKEVAQFPKGIAMHDMYIGLKAERHFKIEFIHNPLLNYRRHDNNASATGEKSTFSRFYQLRYRLYMFYKTIF